MRTTLLLTLSALALGACASIQPVPYTANPMRISSPREEVVALIKANVSPGCIAEPSFDKSMLVVKFVCSGGVGNQVARLDRVERIFLEQYEEWYRVTVRHTGGADFTWTSKSLDDMQRLADAFTALSTPASAPVSPNANTM